MDQLKTSLTVQTLCQLMGVVCDRLRLGSTTALGCRTGQNKSRYCKKELSFLRISLIEQDKSKPSIYTLGLCQASKHSCKETTQCCGGCQLFCLQNRHKLQKTNLQTRNFLFLWTLLLWNFKRFLRY